MLNSQERVELVRLMSVEIGAKEFNDNALADLIEEELSRETYYRSD